MAVALRKGDVGLVRLRPDDFEGRWWAVHTKSRNEKALARDLDQLGIGCFLPLARVDRRHSGRTTQVHLPLFPGYLFMCGEAEDRYAALNTRRAVRVIDVGDQDGFKTSLRHIHCMVNSDRPVDVYPGIRRGRLVRVARGPLLGLEGVVLRRRGVCRIYVAIDMLGHSAEVEVDGGVLEVID